MAGEKTPRSENAGGEGGQEVLDEAAVDHNLLQMDSLMWQILMKESVGANAGSFEIEGRTYPCAAVNGYADFDTGRIAVFGHTPDVASAITEKDREFTFRVALDAKAEGGAMKGRGFFRIAGIYKKGNFSPRAQAALEASVKRWNKMHEESGV